MELTAAASGCYTKHKDIAYKVEKWKAVKRDAS